MFERVASAMEDILDENMVIHIQLYAYVCMIRPHVLFFSVCTRLRLYMGLVRKELILVRTFTLEKVASALKKMHERKNLGY